MLISIKEDIYRNSGNGYKMFPIRLKYVLHPINRYLYYLRRYQASGHFHFFWAILISIRKFRTGIQIPPQTKIGRGIRLLHFGNIVVNPNAVIGDNFNIAQGCLIGGSFVKGVYGVPIIGNNVCIFANSIVVGGVKIGNDVLIAPGAFVNFDVPSNSIVIGNPGRIIRKEESPTKKYIVYSVYDFK